MTLLKIPFSTQNYQYTLSKLCNDRYSVLSVLWADRLSDVMRAVEAIVEGTDVMFHSTLNGEINLTQSLDGIPREEYDFDEYSSIYFIKLGDEYLAFFYRGQWFTRSNKH